MEGARRRPASLRMRLLLPFIQAHPQGIRADDARSAVMPLACVRRWGSRRPPFVPLVGLMLTANPVRALLPASPRPGRVCVSTTDRAWPHSAASEGLAEEAAGATWRAGGEGSGWGGDRSVFGRGLRGRARKRTRKRGDVSRTLAGEGRGWNGRIGAERDVGYGVSTEKSKKAFDEDKRRLVFQAGPVALPFPLLLCFLAMSAASSLPVPPPNRHRASSTNVRPPLTLASLGRRRSSSLHLPSELAPIPGTPCTPCMRDTPALSLSIPPPREKPAPRSKLASMFASWAQALHPATAAGPEQSFPSTPSSPLHSRASTDDSTILPMSASPTRAYFGDLAFSEKPQAKAKGRLWEGHPSVRLPLPSLA